MMRIAFGPIPELPGPPAILRSSSGLKTLPLRLCLLASLLTGRVLVRMETAPVVQEPSQKHARIHGTPASTKALIRGVRPLGGRIPASYRELRRLNDRSDEILSETRDRINRQYTEAIAALGGGQQGGALRAEDTGVHALRTWLLSKIVRRPPSPEAGAALSRERIRTATGELERTRDALIQAESENIRKSSAFLQENPALLARAGEEEDIIGVLSGLSADYHIFSDLCLTGRPGESVRIDLLVIGPSGVFLLDTRDCRTSGRAPGENRLRQIREAHDRLLGYLQSQLKEEREIRIRNLVIVAGGLPDDRAYGSDPDIVAPDALCRFIGSRAVTLSPNQVTAIAGLLLRR